MKIEERINKIINEKEQYQLQAIRLEAENTALKAILTKRDESVTEQTKIILNLEAENKRLKEVIIKALKDKIIQWKKEYDIIDSIVDLKDAVIAELKAENERLKRELSGKRFICPQCMEFAKEIHKYQQTLQEIKEIADAYHHNKPRLLCNMDKFIEQILQKITKAESEEV